MRRPSSRDPEPSSGGAGSVPGRHVTPTRRTRWRAANRPAPFPLADRLDRGYFYPAPGAGFPLGMVRGPRERGSVCLVADLAARHRRESIAR